MSTEPSELQPIHAVVVTFNPDLLILNHTLASLGPQVDGIVVVDNGGSEAVRRHLQALAERDEIVLIRQARNIGLAAAQNIGVDVARQRGAGAVLLLDQDSEPEPMMVLRLKEAWHQLQDSGRRPGLMAPSYYCAETGFDGRFVVRQGARYVACACAKNEIRSVDVAIASGSLIPLSVFDAVGRFDEGFFIDAVDTDWCLRARAAGYSIFAVGNARLTHRLGDDCHQIWFFGRQRRILLHTPLRSYTIARNNLALAARPHGSTAWRRFAVAMLAHRFLCFVVFGPQRWRHAKALARGIIDALRGRAGEPAI